jgi:hypothetical protein
MLPANDTNYAEENLKAEANRAKGERKQWPTVEDETKEWDSHSSHSSSFHENCLFYLFVGPA